MRRWLIGLLACLCVRILTVPCAAKETGKQLTDAAQVVQALHTPTEYSGRETAAQTQSGQVGRFVVTDAKPDETFGAKRVYTYLRYTLLEYADPAAAAAAVRQIRQENPNVLAVQDRLLKNTAVPTLSANAPAYGGELLGLDTLCGRAKDWPGSATVAVIDSGINRAHIWFKDRLDTANSVNFAGDTANSSAYADLSGHGTHVAGIITQNTPPQVKVMAVRVFDADKNASLLTILLGVDHALEHGAAVINLSLGQGMLAAEEAELANRTFRRAVEAGCVVAAAAGNEYGDVAKSFPASSAWTISVGSMEVQGGKYVRSDFSNCGALLDFAAPGRNIRSAWIGSETETRIASGTSMATPFLAAQAACIKLRHPQYGQADVYTVLQDYSTDIGKSGKDADFGYGYADLSDYGVQDTDDFHHQVIETTAVLHTSMDHAGESLSLSARLKHGDGTLSFAADTSDVVKLSGSTAEVVGVGTCSLTVTASATPSFAETRRTVQIIVDRGTQCIELPKRQIIKPLGAPFLLEAALSRGDGTLRFQTNDNPVLDVMPDGIVTPKSAGTAQIYVTAEATKLFKMQVSEPIEVTITDPNACPLCGRTHSGFLGSILRVLHRIIYNLKTIFIRGNTL